MMDDSSTLSLHRQAISAALNCEWDNALQINKELIKTEPENVDCLNRLAKAYMELGKYSQAKKICEEVLVLDPYNTIAQKNLTKVNSFKKNSKANHNGVHEAQKVGIAITPDLFLEEPGTTKMVNLIKVAEPQKLLVLFPGQAVNLVTKNKGIFVTDSATQYLGVLPDDTGFHLRKLIAGGNKYMAIIKSIKANGITILIREIFRSKKFKNQASFLNDSKALSYSSDNISPLIGGEMEEIAQEQAEMEESSL